jgi:transcriptional regulator GlxA family with amidase domain
MAVQAGLSRSRFEHLFREQTGQTFRAALREFRLAKGAGLLGDWTRRIKEVAGLCGYSSNESFAKVFRKRFGETPQGYRRSTIGQEIAHSGSKLKLTA